MVKVDYISINSTKSFSELLYEIRHFCYTSDISGKNELYDNGTNGVSLLIGLFFSQLEIFYVLVKMLKISPLFR